jgi:glycine C-acetyltransferase
MLGAFQQIFGEQLNEIREAGLYKTERPISTPQRVHIRTADGREVLNLCANNYLGLADYPEVIEAAKAALDRWGFGLASVRFICGTQEIHKELEDAITQFHQTEDTILYGSCFDANGGLFETILSNEDAVISDELNHASIIDGIRLSKANRYRFHHNDMEDLETKLKETRAHRCRLIATDGVFSMDGKIANLKEICGLADKYAALVMVDECHAAGFIGRTGRGTPEHHGVIHRIDIITGTLGKALGGGSGGYATGRKAIIELLRQRSRPYLFSNSLTPCTVAASIKAIEIASRSTELRDRLENNTHFFRIGLAAHGLAISPGTHPIVPVMIGDAALSQTVANKLLNLGIYVIGFFYPVVPQGTARIRTQVSAAHSIEDLQLAIEQFAKVRQEYNLEYPLECPVAKASDS